MSIREIYFLCLGLAGGAYLGGVVIIATTVRTIPKSWLYAVACGLRWPVLHAQTLHKRRKL